MQFVRWLPVLLGIGSAAGQTPVVDCVVQDAVTQNLVAYFGYTGNAGSAAIPAGPNNTINNSGALIGNLPTAFASAAEHVLFAVQFRPGQSATWTLGGKTASAAAASSPVCQVAVGTVTNRYARNRCWDVSLANNTCDAAEDIDGDGFCTILDCAGRPGTQGAAGAAGPAGPQGPPGPPGGLPSLQTIRTASKTVNPTANCGATQFLVTGGGVCAVQGRIDLGRLRSSVATAAGDGWSVECDFGDATAVAVCAARP